MMEYRINYNRRYAGDLQQIRSDDYMLDEDLLDRMTASEEN